MIDVELFYCEAKHLFGEHAVEVMGVSPTASDVRSLYETLPYGLLTWMMSYAEGALEEAADKKESRALALRMRIIESILIDKGPRSTCPRWAEGESP